MAQKVTVALEDDLTGGPADQTVRFAFDGTEYEIDLNAKNAAASSKLLAPYVGCQFFGKGASCIFSPKCAGDPADKPSDRLM